MEVICIDAKPDSEVSAKYFKLVELNIYDVVQDKNFKKFWWVSALNQGYSKRRFIPLSTIDETEFHREFGKVEQGA